MTPKQVIGTPVPPEHACPQCGSRLSFAMVGDCLPIEAPSHLPDPPELVIDYCRGCAWHSAWYSVDPEDNIPSVEASPEGTVQ